MYFAKMSLDSNLEILQMKNKPTDTIYKMHFWKSVGLVDKPIHQLSLLNSDGTAKLLKKSSSLSLFLIPCMAMQIAELDEAITGHSLSLAYRGEWSLEKIEM